MKIYIVNWKEATFGQDGETFVESGVCDYGYRDEENAVKQIEALAREKADECVKECGYADVSGEGDWRCVEAGSNAYKYFITVVEVE